MICNVKTNYNYPISSGDEDIWLFVPNMEWKTFLSCNIDKIVILRLSHPKHAPYEIRFHLALLKMYFWLLGQNERQAAYLRSWNYLPLVKLNARGRILVRRWGGGGRGVGERPFKFFFQVQWYSRRGGVTCFLLACIEQYKKILSETTMPIPWHPI